jgi:hypothetical protein
MISFCIKLLIIITSPKVTCSRRDLADKLLTGRFTSFQSLTDLTNFNRSLKQFSDWNWLSEWASEIVCVWVRDWNWLSEWASEIIWVSDWNWYWTFYIISIAHWLNQLQSFTQTISLAHSLIQFQSLTQTISLAHSLNQFQSPTHLTNFNRSLK